VAIVSCKRKTNREWYERRRNLDSRLQWKIQSGKEGARRRLYAFLVLAQAPPETPFSNQWIPKDPFERHRLYWCRGCLLFSNAIHRRSLALPLNRQTEHTWSLLLSLRRSPAQLSTITTSYSTFIGQAAERCSFPGNVHPPCSVSCRCLDFQNQILATD